MPELVVEGLTKRFRDVVAVDRVSLTVKDGEFVTLLGPSGCGKSTTLAAIAGLDRSDEGQIRVGDAVFFDSATGRFLPPERRNCGLVFQSYALWPHMTVYENLAFPLKLRKVPAAEQRARIEEVLHLVEMEAYATRHPHQLSGGQQQRVALARTLVYRPAILLLDEPLSNLDAKLRERARSWLSRVQSRVGITTVYVTHDQIEALTLSDRIAVMRSGRIVQMGTPKEVYETPADPFVADFIGTSSFFRGVTESAGGEGDAVTVRLESGRPLVVRSPRPLTAGTAVVVAVRPEKVRLVDARVADAGTEPNLLEARVAERSYVGARYQYQLEVAGSVLRIDAPAELAEPTVWVSIPPEGCAVFTQDGLAAQEMPR